MKCSTELSDGVSYPEKLTGFMPDGASTSRGRIQSVKSILRDKSPWLVFMCCIVHRLELSLNDTLKDTNFKEVDEMLVQLYLLYTKAPKILRRLKELYDI